MVSRLVFDLIEMFPQPGCAICNLLLQDVAQFLDSLLYERVNTLEVQQGFRRARGLCAQHASELVTVRGGSLGIAILHRAVLIELLDQVEGKGGGRFSVRRAESLANSLRPDALCPACDLIIGQEKRYLEALVGGLSDSTLQAAYEDSGGLCLPHSRLLIRRAPPSLSARLVAVQRAQWEYLKQELEEFIAKTDYRRSGEEKGAERDSWLRAARLISGEPGIFGIRAGRESSGY